MNSTSQQSNTEKKIEAIFWPVTDGETGEIAAYQCDPMMSLGDGNCMNGDDVLMVGGKERVLDQPLLAKNLVSVLELVGQFLRDKEMTGDNSPVIVPLNAVAVSVPSVANAFADKCREIESQFSGRLIFEIFNFPENFTLDYLDQLGILVFPFSKYYTARPSPSQIDFKNFANCNFQGVAFDLKNKPWPADKIRPHLEKFRQSAEFNRLVPHLRGVGSQEILDVARELDFKFFSGSVVQPAQ